MTICGAQLKIQPHVGPLRGQKTYNPNAAGLRIQEKTYNPNAAGPRIRRKTYNPSRPAQESGEKHTIQTVRPENPEKKIQSKPSGPKIRKSENKPIIQTILLVVGCWLLVVGVVDNPRRGPLWGQTYNPNAAGRGIRRKTYNPSRLGRKSEKKPTIQPVLLVVG